MGTQFQRRTTPSTWDPEAVMADSAWNLEVHHVITQARLQLPERIPEAYSTVGGKTCVALAAKEGSCGHRPLCHQVSPSWRTLPCCGFSAWNLLGPNHNPNPTQNREPPPKPMPRSLILHLSGLLAWAVTSALEGDHKTGVVSGWRRPCTEP